MASNNTIDYLTLLKVINLNWVSLGYNQGIDRKQGLAVQACRSKTRQKDDIFKYSLGYKASSIASLGNLVRVYKKRPEAVSHGEEACLVYISEIT